MNGWDWVVTFSSAKILHDSKSLKHLSIKECHTWLCVCGLLCVTAGVNDFHWHSLLYLASECLQMGKKSVFIRVHVCMWLLDVISCNTLKCHRFGANHSWENLIFITVSFWSWRQPDRHERAENTPEAKDILNPVFPRFTQLLHLLNRSRFFGCRHAHVLSPGLCLKQATTKQPQRPKPIGLQKIL